MSRLLKWIAIVVGAALTLVLVLSTVLYFTVDEDELKQRLIAAADRQLNAHLSIDGEFALRVLPSLQLAVADVRLVGPGESTEEIAAAQALRFGADLWPLLHGEISISELTLEGLRLHLHRSTDGRGNWESLRRADASPAQPAQPGQPAPDASSASSPLDLAFERVRIEDGAVDFRDERAGKRYQLQFLTLRGDGVDLQGDPFRLDAEGRVVIDEGKQDLQLALGTEMRVDLRAQSIRLSDATLRLARTGGPALDLRLPAIDIALDRKRVELQPFWLASEMLEGNATLAVDWSDAAAVQSNGAVHLTRLNLAALAPALGIALPTALNPEPLGAMTLDATLARTGDELRLTEIHLRAGELRVEGALAFTGGQHPQLDANLTGPAIDLDYLLPPPPIPPGPAPASVASPDTDTTAAVETPLAEQLTLSGRIEAAIGSLKRRGVELSEVKTTLVLQPGSVQLEQLSAGLYGGTLTGSGKLDARGAGQLALDAKLAAVDVRALLAAAKQPERMTGRLDGTLTLRAKGTRSPDWVASLEGPLTLEVHDPVIREMSVEKVVCTAVATLNKEMLSAQFPADTTLDTLAAALDFTAGVGKFRSLSATLPDMALTGKGKIDLPERRLAIQLDARVTKDLATLDPACRMTRKMQKVEWPLTCKGSFDEPAKKWCRIDDDDLAKIAGQVAGEKLKDKLKEKLGDLFKRH